MRLRTSAVAVAVSGLFALAACGGEEGEAPAAVGADAGEGGGGELTPMTIGYFPLVHTAPVIYADREGIFEENGLDVTLEQTAGGAQAIPSLVAGQYDVTYGNYVSSMLAASQGLPLVLVAGNDVGGTDHGLFVTPDSPIQSPADLAGKRVAVNNLNNIGTVAIKGLVEDAGVDPGSVELVELPLPDMPAALERGDVDAIWQVEPFQARAASLGLREFSELFTGPTADLPVAGWVSREQFVQENPEALDAFERSLEQAMDALEQDPAILEELVPTYTQVPAEVVQQIAPINFEAELDRDALQRIAEGMERYGLIQEPFDVAQVLPEE